MQFSHHVPDISQKLHRFAAFRQQHIRILIGGCKGCPSSTRKKKVHESSSYISGRHKQPSRSKTIALGNGLSDNHGFSDNFKDTFLVVADPRRARNENTHPWLFRARRRKRNRAKRSAVFMVHTMLCSYAFMCWTTDTSS